MERDPALARLHLLIGCFVALVGPFIAWNDFEKFVFASLMLVSLGGVMFSRAAMYALPDIPGPARTTVRALNVVFVLATISLAATTVLSEVR